MKIVKLLELAQKGAKGKLDGVTEEAANALVQAAFKLVLRQIHAANDGVVNIEGLGRFQIRQAEREKDGQQVKVKRISFKPERAKGRKAKETK